VEATTPLSIAGNAPQPGKRNLNPQTIIYRLGGPPYGSQYTDLLLARKAEISVIGPRAAD
jgi:hypothetical protein